MMSDVPVEISAASRYSCEFRQERTAGNRSIGEIWLISSSPEVVERDVNAAVRRCAPDGRVHDTNCRFVVGDDLLQGSLAEIVPMPVRLQFVSDDPAPNSSV